MSLLVLSLFQSISPNFPGLLVVPPITLLLVMNLGTLFWVFPSSSLSTSKCESPAQTEGSRAHWALHMKPRVPKSIKQPHGTEGCQLCLTRPTAQYKMWTLNRLPYCLLLIVIMKLIT